MIYSSIYKNGKPDYFFIRAESPKEWALVQPYFLLSSIDKPRVGRIRFMECLFSGDTWYGKQTHGYGYSASHDVYGQLIDCIEKLYKGKLTTEASAELHALNTHDDRIQVSETTLDELEKLNAAALAAKYNL